MTASVDRKIYDAYRANRGVRLTADDVDTLFSGDNAIAVRISNQACIEAQIDELGDDLVSGRRVLPTWPRFVKELKGDGI